MATGMKTEPDPLEEQTLESRLAFQGVFLKVYADRVRSPDGHEIWGKWVFRAIEKPNRLAYVVSFCNEAGDPVRHPMAPLWPLEVLVEHSFSESNGKTVFESRSWPINATAEERAVFMSGHAGMQAAFGATFAQLDAHLATLA